MSRGTRLVLLLALSLGARRAGAVPLASEEFAEIQRLSRRIQALCPPAECIVVGVGRSPTPLIAYLQTEAADYAYNVPFSLPVVGLGEKGTVSQKEFDQRLEKRVPQARGRRILAVDYSHSGENLFTFCDLLKNHYFARGEGVRIDAFAITNSFYERIARAGTQGRGLGAVEFEILSDRNPLFEKFLKNDYDAFAEYPSFNFGEKGMRKLGDRSKAAYEAFKEEIRGWKRKSCVSSELGSIIPKSK